MSKLIDYFKEPPESAHKLTNKAEIVKTYRLMRIKVFFGMYLGYVVYYLTRKNLSPGIALFSHELKVDVIELGIIASVGHVVYGIGKFLSGVLADKADMRKFMALGLLLSSLVNFFYGYLVSIWALVFFWGLNSGVQSMGFPPVAKGLVHWFSPSERGTKWTLWSSSHTLGAFLVGQLVALLIFLYHQGYIGWQSIFYVPGVIGLLSSFFLFKTLCDRPSVVGLPPVEDFFNDPLPLKKEGELSQWQTLVKYVFANKFVWYLSFAYIFIYLIRFGTLDWAVLFMDERGVGKVQNPLLWSLMPLFGMPGGIMAGYLSDKLFQGRCTQINIIYMLFLALSIWGFYLFAGPDHMLLSSICIAGIGFFVDGPQNLVGGVQMSRITVREATSAACGFAGFFSYAFGATSSGIVLAWITQTYSWRETYMVLVASCFIAIFFIALTWKQEFLVSKN
ncbi:MAG: MFS transporter [Oligoflexia bacterium]|nr:MFS transporter [Oligoflexia bacterium]MBF0366144.1 MFS transporter [Oligoflexia bacterium]